MQQIVFFLRIRPNQKMSTANSFYPKKSFPKFEEVIGRGRLMISSPAY